MPQPRHLPSSIKLILDFAPLGAFFAAYKLADIMTATMVLMAATAIALAVIYVVERKLALAPLITGVLVAFFGGLTIWLKDPQFIKLKPTFINLTFAIGLLVGAYGFKRGLLRPILGMALELREDGWLLLSKRWGFFFLFLAGLNEFIWRTFPTEFWVNFKVFGMFTLTMAFAVSQYKLIEKYSL